VGEIEEALHMGTAGVADEAFWQPVFAYAQRHGAPAETRAALDLVYGMARWDWPRVLAAAPTLIEAQRTNRAWVNPDVLREAVVTAHLRMGNPEEARVWLGRLTLPPRATNAAHDFRTKVLFWYIAEQRGLTADDQSSVELSSKK